MKQIKVFAPATIGNFNVGYDVLGLSLNNIGDELILEFNNSGKNKISKIINGPDLPYETDKNSCSVVIAAMQKAVKDKRGLDIVIKKGFASGSGMGSSSASSAAAAFGYNELVGAPYSRRELIHFAALGEKIACGTAHVDNVAPSLLGGIVLSSGKSPEEILQLPIIDDLYAVTLLPGIKINTSDARKILKDSVSKEIYSRQLGYMGAFVSSLYKKDLDLFSASMKDMVVEPMRSILIPRFRELKETALQNSALAFGISGSGPSVFAIAHGEDKAEIIRTKLEKVYKGSGMNVITYCNAIVEDSGARII